MKTVLLLDGPKAGEWLTLADHVGGDIVLYAEPPRSFPIEGSYEPNEADPQRLVYRLYRTQGDEWYGAIGALVRMSARVVSERPGLVGRYLTDVLVQGVVPETLRIRLDRSTYEYVISGYRTDHAEEKD
jgi:hypothetical protein